VIQLFNEDCFDRLKQIDDNSINAIISDPPYGILNHKIETNIDIEKLMSEWQRVLKNNGFLVYFGRQPTFTEWNNIAFKYFKYKKEIIWYKKQRSSPNNDIGNYFENIMVCSKGNNTAKFNKTYIPYTDTLNSLSDFNGWDSLTKMLSIFKLMLKDNKSLEDLRAAILTDTRMYGEYSKSKRTSIVKQLKRESHNLQNMRTCLNGYQARDVVGYMTHNKTRFNDSEFNIEHPTVKPIQLMEYLISLTTKENDIILDNFMGSGTTGLAAKKLNRNFIGVEIHQEYFNISKYRIDNLNLDNENLETTENLDLFQ